MASAHTLLLSVGEPQSWLGVCPSCHHPLRRIVSEGTTEAEPNPSENTTLVKWSIRSLVECVECQHRETPEEARERQTRWLA